VNDSPGKKIMRIIILCFLILKTVTGGLVEARDTFLEVVVTDPFIEMHTGPASGYPVFHVVERGEKITVIVRKTDWFKIRTSKNKEGWAHRNELVQTLTLDGKETEFRDVTFEGFKKRRWEVGLMTGDFEGAASLTLFGTYYLTPTLSTELSATHAIGNFSSSLMANVRIAAHPFPEWRISPFMALGSGYIQTTPNATLVRTVDRDDPLAHVSFGANIYISKRFIFRMEYNNYKIFTSRDNNEEIEEWKAGFSAFF